MRSVSPPTELDDTILPRTGTSFGAGRSRARAVAFKGPYGEGMRKKMRRVPSRTRGTQMLLHPFFLLSTGGGLVDGTSARVSEPSSMVRTFVREAFLSFSVAFRDTQQFDSSPTVLRMRVSLGGRGDAGLSKRSRRDRKTSGDEP